MGIRFSMICYDISIVVWACLLKKCDSKRMSKQTVLQRLSPPFHIQTLLHSEFAEIVPFPFITTCHLPRPHQPCFHLGIAAVLEVRTRSTRTLHSQEMQHCSQLPFVFNPQQLALGNGFDERIEGKISAPFSVMMVMMMILCDSLLHLLQNHKVTGD